MEDRENVDYKQMKKLINLAEKMNKLELEKAQAIIDDLHHAIVRTEHVQNLTGAKPQS